MTSRNNYRLVQVVFNKQKTESRNKITQFNHSAVPFGCSVITVDMLLQITRRAAWVTGRRWMAAASAWSTVCL